MGKSLTKNICDGVFLAELVSFWLFLQKRSTINVWQGPKYALGEHLEGDKLLLKRNRDSTINEIAPIQNTFALREMWNHGLKETC